MARVFKLDESLDIVQRAARFVTDVEYHRVQLALALQQRSIEMIGACLQRAEELGVMDHEPEEEARYAI
jgi:hypothetical protein